MSVAWCRWDPANHLSLFIFCYPRYDQSLGMHNKLVIFTRTKPELHHIAHSWPVSGVSALSSTDIAAPLTELLYDDLDKLVLSRLDHIHTEVGFSCLWMYYSVPAVCGLNCFCLHPSASLYVQHGTELGAVGSSEVSKRGGLVIEWYPSFMSCTYSIYT